MKLLSDGDHTAFQNLISISHYGRVVSGKTQRINGCKGEVGLCCLSTAHLLSVN